MQFLKPQIIRNGRQQPEEVEETKLKWKQCGSLRRPIGRDSDELGHKIEHSGQRFIILGEREEKLDPLLELKNDGECGGGIHRFARHRACDDARVIAFDELDCEHPKWEEETAKPTQGFTHRLRPSSPAPVQAREEHAEPIRLTDIERTQHDGVSGESAGHMKNIPSP